MEDEEERLGMLRSLIEAGADINQKTVNVCTFHVYILINGLGLIKAADVFIEAPLPPFPKALSLVRQKEIT